MTETIPIPLPITLEQMAVHLVESEMAIVQRDVQLRGRDEFSRGHYISVFSYGAAWPYRERHPAGDELVFVLSGDATMALGDVGDVTDVNLHAGMACVVPRGEWHRLASDEPCMLLFVTPSPARTEHEHFASA